MTPKLPPRLRFLLLLAAIHLAIFTGCRLVLWRAYGYLSPNLSSHDLVKAFRVGFMFDARLVVAALLPFGLLSGIPFLDPARPRARLGWCLWLFAVDTFLLFVYAVDFANFGWLHERMNASLLDNLLAPGIAIDTIRQTFPLPLLLTAFVLVLGGDFLLNRWLLGRACASDSSAGPSPRREMALAWGTAVLLAAALLWGKVSHYPLRWSDAFFSSDSFASALASNPLLYFIDTLAIDRHPAFDEKALRAAYPMLAAHFGVDHPDEKTLSFRRDVPVSSHALPGKPNIVIVFMESFAALKVGRFGHTPDLDPTPEFDKITRQSIFFSHFFVPRYPTHRAIFATLFGIPDVNPDRSASRNPRIVRQHTIANAFAGYDKLYLLGGSANWANIRGMLSANIPGLQLHEEGSYPEKADDVWGINDLALLEESDKAFRKEQKPFLAFVQLAGNHYPFTIPDDKRTFQTVSADDATLRKNGFDSLASYNGIRFMDYSIANFFKVAGSQPYFKNTVFFLYGDHGTATTLDAPYEKINIAFHHIPLCIYSPGNLEPRQIDDVVSSVDVLPTAAGLAGVPYVDTTFGRDMLEPRPAAEHFAYVDVGTARGLIGNELALYFDPAGKGRLYRYDAIANPTRDLSAELPDQRKEMGELTDALQNLAGWMLYNNPPVPPLDEGGSLTSAGP